MEFIFLKELMVIEQVHQKNVIFGIIGKGFKVHAYFCNRWHDLLMTFINLSDMSFSNIKSSNYCCIISLTSKNEAINLMQNTDLTKKRDIITKISITHKNG